MQFIPKEHSLRLEQLGCASKILFGYYENWPAPIYDIKLYPSDQKYVCQAFSVLDFLSSEDYAIENCKRLFKDQMVGDLILAKERWMNDDYRPNFELKRIELLQTKDQVKFIEDAVNAL